MTSEMKQPPTTLNETQRQIVENAIKEVCEFRSYGLQALNVRSNHVHVVVSKDMKPEKIVNDFKVYSTRRLREAAEFPVTAKIWARGSSTRYLWKPRHVEAAVAYVLYSQGDIEFVEF
jgi:REP element-mobilizing transposase RayT